jgi:uncharacterized membrane protein YphA (DoxX/SURF4 family)
VDISLKPIISNRWFLLAARILLGIIFVTAGLSKMGHLLEFSDFVAGYNILPPILSKIYGYAVPYTEVFIGIVICFGFLPRITLGIGFILIISYLVANIYALIVGRQEYCNCFGQTILIEHYQALLIDILMLLLIVLLSINLFKSPNQHKF